MSELNINLMAAFRQLFVPHHFSLEFRAKIFAAMLLAKGNQDESDYEKVAEIGREIYPKEPKRVNLLCNLTNEYVTKANVYKSLNLDSLLKDIDEILKNQKKFTQKINFSHLRRMLSKDEDEALIQQRVYEFLLSEVKRYAPEAKSKPQESEKN